MIFVTGANGMLGSYVREVFKGEDLKLTDVDTLDIKDPEDVMRAIREAHPQFVLHLAAKTNVDQCETEESDAYLANAAGTNNVALACREIDAVMIYISTTEVFDGNKNEPYIESDAPSPINVYGKTKLKGEENVQLSLKKYYIIRTCWLMGGREKDSKFVGKMIKLFGEKKRIKAVDDKIGSPTYAYDLIKTIKELIRTDDYGLYHFTNEGSCSRYEMAMEIGRILKRDVPVEPVSSSLFPLPAPRGKSVASRNYKLELLNMVEVRTWQEALEDYLKSWVL